MSLCACGSDKIRARGRCANCYQKHYIATHPDFHERHLARQRAYQREHYIPRPRPIKTLYPQALCRVAVKGWGVRIEDQPDTFVSLTVPEVVL